MQKVKTNPLVDTETTQKVISCLKVNIVGDHSQVISEFGLTTGTGRDNKWLGGSAGTLLPSLTIATPTNIGSTFNSRLKGGNASAQEWINWAGEDEPKYGVQRGYHAHSGISQFLSIVNVDQKVALNNDILSEIHQIFIAKIRGYESELSDVIFSKEAFKSYDTVIEDIFDSNSMIIAKYKREKEAIAAARTSPRPRPLMPSKNMGGTIYSITDSKSLLPYYNKIKKNQLEITGIRATESHIFSDEFLNNLSNSSNLLVTKSDIAN